MMVGLLLAKSDLENFQKFEAAKQISNKIKKKIFPILKSHQCQKC